MNSNKKILVTFDIYFYSFYVVVNFLSPNTLFNVLVYVNWDLKKIIIFMD